MNNKAVAYIPDKVPNCSLFITTSNNNLSATALCIVD